MLRLYTDYSLYTVIMFMYTSLYIQVCAIQCVNVVSRFDWFEKTKANQQSNLEKQPSVCVCVHTRALACVYIHTHIKKNN